jgi:uncharacterized protein
MDKKYFFLKLIAPRATFQNDMTDDERTIMHKHVEYWKPYIDDGTVIVFGPVFDPKGVYGMAVIGVEDNDQLDKLVKHDPANGLNTYEIFPMRAVIKDFSK